MSDPKAGIKKHCQTWISCCTWYLSLFWVTFESFYGIFIHDFSIPRMKSEPERGTRLLRREASVWMGGERDICRPAPCGCGSWGWLSLPADMKHISQGHCETSTKPLNEWYSFFRRLAGESFLVPWSPVHEFSANPMKELIPSFLIRLWQCSLTAYVSYILVPHSNRGLCKVAGSVQLTPCSNGVT